MRTGHASAPRAFTSGEIPFRKPYGAGIVDVREMAPKVDNGL